MSATIYLIPSLLAEDGTDAIPDYILPAIKECQVFFTENERTTRRYFKQIWKTKKPGEDIVIDQYQWFTIGPDTEPAFRKKIKEGATIGIVSEAGCPGIADSGSGPFPGTSAAGSRGPGDSASAFPEYAPSFRAVSREPCRMIPRA